MNTTRATARASTSRLRGQRAPISVISGAPTTTPRAYALIAVPAVGIETPRSDAKPGSTPMLANSVVPIASPPSESAARLTPAGTRPSGVRLIVDPDAVVAGDSTEVLTSVASGVTAWG